MTLDTTRDDLIAALTKLKEAPDMSDAEVTPIEVLRNARVLLAFLYKYARPDPTEPVDASTFFWIAACLAIKHHIAQIEVVLRRAGEQPTPVADVKSAPETLSTARPMFAAEPPQLTLLQNALRTTEQ